MQELEADLVIDEIVAKLAGESFPLITIHDCVLTTEDGLGPTKKAFKKAFLQLRLKVNLKVKQLAA